MISHLSLPVAELERAVAFYGPVLLTLGYVCSWRTADGAGYGHPDQDEALAFFERPDAQAAGPGFHLAFVAPDRVAVDSFHATGLQHGGHDAGPPGLRAHYAPEYYAAFLIDPDGWKLEAVHQP